MRRSTPALTVVAALAATALIASPAAATTSGLRGIVRSQAEPLERARVYAYELAELNLREVLTDSGGRFLFESLPAGLYKIVAYKVGFVPAIIELSRTAAEAQQFVEVEMSAESGETASGSPPSFWALRERVPPDVLRQMEAARLATEVDPSAQLLLSRRFQAAFRAGTGLDDSSALGEAQRSVAGVGLEGHLGRMAIDLEGTFEQLQALSDQRAGAAGETSSIALALHSARQARIDLSTERNRMSFSEQDGLDAVDFERYRVSWTQPISQRSQSRFSAQYTNQTNFYRLGWMHPAEAPSASRTWRLEGSYRVAFSDRNGLETGVRYLDRVGEAAPLSPTEDLDRRLELFGHGGIQVAPSVLVEYGLFTRLRDGSMSLLPRGGVVLQLGDHWQASSTVSHRIDDGQDFGGSFSPVYFGQMGSCDAVEAHCYRLVLARQGEDGDGFSFGAVEREIGETLQLYFDESFFDHLQSVFLVQGDRLPELQLSVSRRLSPRILTRLESNVASGGGGVVYASDSFSYENRVRYLVTSIDTQFQQSSTGVFVAFHQLEQVLAPVDPQPELDTASKEMESLQLMVTQDLGAFLDLTANWAVQVNMELSRGGLPFLDANDEDAIRRSITGGVSVRF